MSFQEQVTKWMMVCFGEKIAADTVERNHRFLEESLELVQSCGCTTSEAHQLVDYVFNRPVGETQQEMGGVMVTLAALCAANGFDMEYAGWLELANIDMNIDAIREKQANKPKHSPLPEVPNYDPRQEMMDDLRGGDVPLQFKKGETYLFYYQHDYDDYEWIEGIAVDVWAENEIWVMRELTNENEYHVKVDQIKEIQATKPKHSPLAEIVTGDDGSTSICKHQPKLEFILNGPFEFMLPYDNSWTVGYGVIDRGSEWKMRQQYTNREYNIPLDFIREINFSKL